MAHILLTAIRIVTATAVMDQISREGRSASGRTPAECAEKGAVEEGERRGAMRWQNGAALRGIGLRCSRETRRGDGAKGNAKQSWATPEVKRLRGTAGERRKGKGTRRMWFKNGKNPFIKPSRHVLFEGESGQHAGCAPQKGAAGQPPAARGGKRAASQLGALRQHGFLTVNSEIRVHCNCCRCRAKHTNRVGPAVAGDLPYLEREKKAENQ